MCRNTDLIDVFQGFRRVTVPKLEEISRPIVEANGAWLLEVVLRKEHGTSVIEVVIDTAVGVTTDECAAISREISKALDAADVMSQRYYLTVASPGTDRPMTFPAQYKKHVGRKVRIELTKEHGGAAVEGVLLSVTEDNLTIDAGGPAPVTTAFKDVATGIVKTPW